MDSLIRAEHCLALHFTLKILIMKKLNIQLEIILPTVREINENIRYDDNCKVSKLSWKRFL